MLRRRTAILLIISSGLCAVLLALGLNIGATEILDCLRTQTWYTPARLWVAVLMVALVGGAVAVYQFLVTAPDQMHGASFSAVQLMRNRRQMIAKVRHDWIECVLDQSLYHVARIDVRFEDRPDVVDSPLTLIVQEAVKPRRVLPGRTKIKNVFEAHAGLLILGAPGSGKTSLLLELTRELLKLAERQETYRIPVVFNLSSWAARRLPLEAWLAEELTGPLYGLSRNLAEHWVTNEQILPLLDGLDEVANDDRNACAEAINMFRNEHGLLPMAVCCRSDEYHNLAAQLRLPSAVVVQPLKRAEVEEYFGRNKKPLEEVRAAVGKDPMLWELLDNPLMLSVAMVAYREMEEDQPLAGGSIEIRRQQLLAKYVATMFRRRGSEKRHSSIQTTRWLSSLACILSRNSQAIFYLESLDYPWLPTRTQRGLARIGLVVLSGLVGWLIGALVSGLTGQLNGGLLNDGLSVGLIGGLTGCALKLLPVEKIGIRWADMSLQMSKALDASLKLWLGVWLIAGLLLGLLVGIPAALDGEPLGGLSGTLHNELGGGRVGALVGASLVGLAMGLLFGSVTGLFVGLFVGLSRIITSEAVPQTRSVVNEGTLRSIKIALAGGVTTWLSLFLIGQLAGLPGIGISFGLIAGLLVAMFCGGLFALKHLVLRVLLWVHGSAPLRYVAFLARAKKLLFLRQVGGGYIFVHRMLLEYFMSLEASWRISGEARPNPE